MGEFWIGFWLGVLVGSIFSAWLVSRESHQITTKPLDRYDGWYDKWKAKEEVWKKKGNAVKKVKKVK